MTENERVKQLRKARGLTLEKFGERLGVGKSAISKIERAETSVTDQMRRSICREFNVREEWLRDGIGPMEVSRNVSDEIDSFLKDIKTDDHAFRARLVAVLARLTPEEWELMESMARKLADGVAAAQGLRNDEAVDAFRVEADEIAAQLNDEKEATEKSSASHAASFGAKEA